MCKSVPVKEMRASQGLYFQLVNYPNIKFASDGECSTDKDIMDGRDEITGSNQAVPDETRAAERFEISVQGRYRTGNGVARDVPIIEISETGCRFYDRFGRLGVGVEISVKIETIGPIVCTVRWSKDHIVGVQFERPIYGPVFEFIRSKLSG